MQTMMTMVLTVAVLGLNQINAADHAPGVNTPVAQLWTGNELTVTSWVPDFNYNTSSPLDIKEVSVRIQSSAEIHDISYLGAATNRIKAYWVRPANAGPFPAVIFVHWLGDAGTSNRSQFLNEAIELAKRGMASLLVDALWSDVTRFPWTGNNYSADRNTCVRQIKDLRRAIDVMVQQPEVDGHRLGYVGHDFGAMAGAELAGVDTRIKTYVLIAGTPRFRYWFFRWSGLSAKAKEVYAAEMAPADPVVLIKQSEHASFYCQHARTRDEWVSQKEAMELFEAAPGEKEIIWYESDHRMSLPATIRMDRLAWLEKQLLRSGRFIRGQASVSGQFELAFLGDAGVHYRLQTSNDLATWHDWFELDGDGSPKPFTDTEGDYRTIRFYRAIMAVNN